jgi:hypothetical protein
VTYQAGDDDEDALGGVAHRERDGVHLLQRQVHHLHTAMARTLSDSLQVIRCCIRELCFSTIRQVHGVSSGYAEPKGKSGCGAGA